MLLELIDKILVHERDVLVVDEMSFLVRNLPVEAMDAQKVYTEPPEMRHVLAHDRVDVRAVLYERIILEREGRVVVYAPECGRQSCRRESHGHSASPDMGSTGAQRR